MSAPRASGAGERARLEIRVHPGARREGLRRRADGVVQIDVTAPPEGGRANAAVCARLAQLLGVGRGQVTVVRGQSARNKWIEVSGMSEVEALRRLAVAIEEAGGDGE